MRCKKKINELNSLKRLNKNRIFGFIIDKYSRQDGEIHFICIIRNEFTENQKLNENKYFFS